MSDSPFRITSLTRDIDRKQFKCGSEQLDIYLREHVSQDIRRRITACFIALSPDNRIAGYYTLASTSIYLGDLPEEIKNKLPRYPFIPAVRMGRLAVDQGFRRTGLGSAMLADALIRVIRSEIAAYAIVVDAKDSPAAGFYTHHGFIETTGNPLTLFLPLATAKKVLSG